MLAFRPRSNLPIAKLHPNLPSLPWKNHLIEGPLAGPLAGLLAGLRAFRLGLALALPFLLLPPPALAARPTALANAAAAAKTSIPVVSVPSAAPGVSILRSSTKMRGVFVGLSDSPRTESLSEAVSISMTSVSMPPSILPCGRCLTRQDSVISAQRSVTSAQCTLSMAWSWTSELRMTWP